MFGFCFFSGGSEFSGGGDLGYLFFQGGIFVEEAGSTSDDSVKGSIRVCAGQELELFLPSIVLEELRVGDCVDIGVPRGSIGRFSEMGVVSGGVSSVGKVEVFGLIEGFIDG